MPARLAAPQRRNKAMRRLSGAAFALAAIAGIWTFGARLTAIEGSIIYDDGLWEPLSGHRADLAARRAGAAFSDAQGFWASRFRDELGRAYAPADLVYFSRLTPSPCAGAAYAAGSFYCAATETASMDLAFLDLMGRRMVHEGDAGEALLVGRIAATHVQRKLEAGQAGALAAALEADCLTGVWARHAAAWVGALDEGFYARLIEAAREVAENQPRGAVEPDAALLGPGAALDRAAAYGRGRDAGSIKACVSGA